MLLTDGGGGGFPLAKELERDPIFYDDATNRTALLWSPPGWLPHAGEVKDLSASCTLRLLLTDGRDKSRTQHGPPRISKRLGSMLARWQVTPRACCTLRRSQCGAYTTATAGCARRSSSCCGAQGSFKSWCPAWQRRRRATAPLSPRRVRACSWRRPPSRAFSPSHTPSPRHLSSTLAFIIGISSQSTSSHDELLAEIDCAAQDAEQPSTFLTRLHVFVLAHVLRRPLVVIADAWSRMGATRERRSEMEGRITRTPHPNGPPSALDS